MKPWVRVTLIGTCGMAAGLTVLAGVGMGTIDSPSGGSRSGRRAAVVDEKTVSFVRPGLQIRILGASAAPDGTVKVRVRFQDPRGLPLDKDGITTPGALRAGRPGLAAVDVYEREPIGADEPLLGLPNAVCTPHLGFTERQSYESMLGGAFDNVVAFAAGRPINLVPV